MANKVQYGLSNVYYAIATETNGAITYGTPAAIKGAVSMSLSPSGDTTPFYADNTEYFTFTANNGYEGDLEIALLPDAFRTNVLGETITSDGVMVENSAPMPKKFALLFQFEGDVHNKRHVLYYCSCTRPSVESATVEDSGSVQTQTLTITALPRPDTKDIKASSTEETDSTTYNSWFTAVWEASEEEEEE